MDKTIANSKKPLVVCKASAGSGKTFTLAVEYIKLLVVNPYKYRNILAVTFTNKATEEMKMRILSQLYGIWKQIPKSKDYTQAVCSQLGVSEAVASKNAHIALELLLHNYNYFRVETIDSFFQSVMRNLARELDLTANLRIGLNDRQVEELAVDRIIEELNVNAEVLQWIMKYINDSISDDRSWNVISKVKSFGRYIFQDFYKHQSKALDEKTNEKDFFDRYTRDVKTEQQEARERLTEIAEAFFETIEAEGLGINDFSFGSGGVAGFFLKLKAGIFDDSIVGKRVADGLLDSQKWVKKSHPRRMEITVIVEGQLMEMLRYGIDEREKQWLRYQSATVTLAHLNQLRLLTTIERKVRSLNEEANRFLLSDTQHLLYSIINDSDSPFIFEKIGSQLKHVMIDEFQDTGVTQWQNFKVLLEECMSHADTKNLIVGDVKQSIYRWRAGDWRLLNNIDQQFANADERMDIGSLDTNYRSTRNVVDFNNNFFELARESEYELLAEDDEMGAQQLKTAYDKVEQKVPDGKPQEGLVEVKLLTKEDYDDSMLREILDTVERLHVQGIEYNKIAILVRENRYIPLVAQYFMDNNSNIKVVSDEAFRLDASLAVNVIVQALHLLTHPDDAIAKAFLAKSNTRINGDNTLSDNELLISSNDLDRYLPEELVGNRSQLLTTPLYDLAERIYAIFHLDKLEKQSAYVCAFYDQLSKFIEDSTTDIDAFVNEWNETLAAKTIQSDEIDGVRMISIHKSKGLEFDNVIIPFCDWTIERRDSILWCSPQQAPYNQLPLVPINYSSKLKGTVYERDYLSEKLQIFVDNLNLLYVAFTRASKNLFVIGSRQTANNRSRVIADCLPKLVQKLEGAILTGDPANNDEPLTFSYGTLCTPNDNSQSESKAKESDNVFLAEVAPIKINIERVAPKVEFKQSNKSRDFIEAEDESEDKQQTYIKIGSVLHNVFSTIRTADDIDTALLHLREDGVLYDEAIPPERVRTMLRKRMENPQVKEWFSPKWKLFNECTLISIVPQTGETIERRPDRVMLSEDEMVVVDFKFARERDEHKAQVAEYMDILANMGYKNISGYLWYVYSNKITKVSKDFKVTKDTKVIRDSKDSRNP